MAKEHGGDKGEQAKKVDEAAQKSSAIHVASIYSKLVGYIETTGIYCGAAQQEAKAIHQLID